MKEGVINGKPYIVYNVTLAAIMTPMGPVPVGALVQYMAGPKQATKGTAA